MCFYIEKNPFSILLFPGFSRTVSMYRGPVLWWCNSSQWHQPSKGPYNEEKNEAHCSQQEDSFFTYIIRITE